MWSDVFVSERRSRSIGVSSMHGETPKMTQRIIIFVRRDITMLISSAIHLA
jgi:hypothetical protein